MTDTISTRFTSGRLLAKNSLFNIVGQGTPMLVALITIPILIKEIGIERFGILSLAWMVVGYFSLFDLGLGRALTKLTAEKLGTEHENQIPALVWTALFLMVLLGLVGVLIGILVSTWLVYDVLKIPTELKQETLIAFYLLVVSIPIVIATTGLRGILEAYQRFDLVNALRIPLGLLTYLGPLLVLPFSKSLLPVIGILTVGRLIFFLFHLKVCFKTIPGLSRSIVIQRSAMKPLIRFGSWMTVTNLVSPIMVYLDRFLIGAVVSIASVAFYTTSYEVVTKLTIFPEAIVNVLFPAFSTSFAQDRNRTAKLFVRGVKYVFLVLFPIVLLIVILSYEGLNIWLGTEFAQKSTRVLQWLAIGVLFNSLARIPFALVQGAGRPDLTSKLHLVELPFYLLAVWWFLTNYGIEGAAIAWTLRVAIDAIILFAMAKRFLYGVKTFWQMGLTLSLALLVLIFAFLIESIVAKLLFISFILLVFVLAVWFLILAPEERVLFRNRFLLV